MDYFEVGKTLTRDHCHRMGYNVDPPVEASYMVGLVIYAAALLIIVAAWIGIAALAWWIA